MKLLARLLLPLFFLATSALAADPPPKVEPEAGAKVEADPKAKAEAAARLKALRQAADSITYRDGTATLQGGLAKVTVPAKFRFVDAKDTGTILTTIWQNPKSDRILGAIVPEGFDPLGDAPWVAVISYDEDGYVKDDEAATLDYTKLLQDLKEGTEEASKERVKEGYPAIELVGWATPPRYDAQSHKMYWAKELKIGGDPEHTLNYNIRMLGRRGVLVVNVVAGITDLKHVEAATPDILAMVNFQEGHRYADFNASTDKVATYGLAALVAGGIAAKAGFFKLLWVGILAFKKIILVGLLALASYAKKFWAWIRGERKTELPSTPTPPAAP